MKQEFAINYSQCIKQSANWGYDKFYNICNGAGEWITVPWGSWNWTWCVLGVVFFGAFVAAVTTIGVAAYKADKEMERLARDLPF